MGLDWHASEEITEQERHKIAKEEGLDVEDVGKFRSPCRLVNAPKAKDRPAFEQDMKERLERMQERAREEDQKEIGRKNEEFVHHWLENMTVEKLMAENADKFDCKNCPLLKDLQGADSTENLFLGVTVSSCDFRGKGIARDAMTPSEIKDKCYERHMPDEMEEFADELEKILEEGVEEGWCDKEPYEEYKKKWEESEAPFKGELMTKEEYESTPHWRETFWRQAIHWLRTCADYGVMMDTTY